MVLCDGVCNCAYHERCLDPPLAASQLPEDEGWLCPACDCKVRGGRWAWLGLVGGGGGYQPVAVFPWFLVQMAFTVFK